MAETRAYSTCLACTWRLRETSMTSRATSWSTRSRIISKPCWSKSGGGWKRSGKSAKPSSGKRLNAPTSGLKRHDFLPSTEAERRLRQRADHFAEVARNEAWLANQNQAAALTALSNVSRQTSPALAAKLALAAWPRTHDDPGPKLDVTVDALSTAVAELRERRVLCRYKFGVSSAAFSPDGARIATASYGKTAWIWDAATYKEIAVLRGHEGEVRSAAFSPDGALIATASDDKTARIWDAVTYKEIAVLRGHEREVRSAAFSPDGARLLTASFDNTVRLWDAVAVKESAALRYDGAVITAAFSSVGSRIVTASYDKAADLGRGHG
jgi:WD40 repeat protein